MLLTTLSEAGRAVPGESLKDELEALLQEINDEVPPYERVGQVFVVPEWTIENTLLTPTMKLKRNQIEQTYRPQIEQCLGGERVNFLQG